MRQTKGKIKDFLILGVVKLPGIVSIMFLMLVLMLSFWDETKGFTFDRYIDELANRSDFWFDFWNSCLISVPILIGTVAVGTIGGFGLAKYKFRGKKLLLTLYVLFMMIPFQVFLAPQYRVLYECGMIDSEWSVILPNMFSPFGAYMIYNYALQIQDSTMEAARLDGCTELRLFWNIILPQLKTGIAALATLSLIDSWNLVEQPMTFLTEQYKYPLAITLNASGGNFAGCLIYIIPILLIFMLGKETLVDGLGKLVLR